jgi:hypothetical protein
MPLDSVRARQRVSDPWVRSAVVLWLVVLAVVSGTAAVSRRGYHSLYPTYAAAGGDWVAGANLYEYPHADASLDQYRYSPLVTVALVPFHYLPERLGGVLWRLLNAALFLGGFHLWLRDAAPAAVTQTQRGVLFVLLLPLALSSLQNGQPNLAVIGFLLLASAAVNRDRWAPAALWVALACALKLYPLAVGLLLAAAYPRRFVPRLLAALALTALLPFLFQTPGYVADQYAQWYERLGDDDRKHWPPHMSYRDLWLLLRVWHVEISPRAYLGVQLLAAAGCAAVCVAGPRRGWPRERVLLAVLTLGACWMMLCGPATESSTYVLLAPALAWGIVSASWECWRGGEKRGTWGAYARLLGHGLSGALLLSCVLAGVFPNANQFHALGLQPLAALLFFAGSLGEAVYGLFRPGARIGWRTPAAPARAA